MSRRVYIDTSVVGGYFDEEFEFWAKLFFQSVRNGKFSIVVSELLTQELVYAPRNVKAFLDDISEEDKVYVELTEEAENLANAYITGEVVGIKSMVDCRHIACATVNQVEILTSWNFKHIVNLDKIHLYNGINLQKGYRTIEIRTPREILSYEN